MATKVTMTNATHEARAPRSRAVQSQRNKERDNKTRGTVQLLCSVILITVGCGLLGFGFTAPPKGEIHSSVLIAFGEILTFVGALFGIDYHYKFTQK